MKALRTTTTLTALLIFGACGTTADLNPPDPAATSALTSHENAASDDAFEAIVASEDYDKRSLSPECLALRAQISTLRKALNVHTDWLSLIAASAWKKLDDGYGAYKQNNCEGIVDAAPPTSDACAALEKQVHDDWAAVVALPEWQVVVTNGHLEPLLDKWKRAKAIHCIAP